MADQPLPPGAKPSTAKQHQPILKRQRKRITIVCKKDDPKGKLTTVENVIDSDFRCPICGELLVFIKREHKLGAHGKTEAEVKAQHELRKVQEQGSISV